MGGAPCGNTVLTPTHVVPTLAFRWLGESSARCRATVPSDGSRFAGPGVEISLHVSASLFRCPPRTGHATESTAALSEALTLWYQDRSGRGYVFSHPMAAPIGRTPRIVTRKRAVFTLQLLRHGRGGAALRLCAYDVRSKI